MGLSQKVKLLDVGLKTVVHMSTLSTSLDDSHAVVRRALLAPSSSLDNFFAWLSDLCVVSSSEVEFIVCWVANVRRMVLH